MFEDSQLGSSNVVTHSINTGDSPPIKQPARRIPFALRKKAEELVDDMLQKRVIHPSNSPWASPVVLVAKKNGDTRFCVDYRRLNSVTKMDVVTTTHFSHIQFGCGIRYLLTWFQLQI